MILRASSQIMYYCEEGGGVGSSNMKFIRQWPFSYKTNVGEMDPIQIVLDIFCEQPLILICRIQDGSNLIKFLVTTPYFGHLYFTTNVRRSM